MNAARDATRWTSLHGVTDDRQGFLAAFAVDGKVVALDQYMGVGPSWIAKD